MLAEMIENMYATDIFADEDMRGESEQEIHVIQTDSEIITVRREGDVSNRGRIGRRGKCKNREEEEEENEGIHESIST